MSEHPFTTWLRSTLDTAKAEHDSRYGGGDLVIPTPRALLESLLEPDDCWLDHHGGCQAHGYLQLAPGELCPQAQLKALLSGYDRMRAAESWVDDDRRIAVELKVQDGYDVDSVIVRHAEERRPATVEVTVKPTTGFRSGVLASGVPYRVWPA